MIPTENEIGPYRLLDALGKGGMGVVWRAAHQETGQVVALKTILVPKKGMLRSIRREVQSLARLRHPGIVKIVEEGVHNGLPYYAMELLEGQTLSVWREALSSQPFHSPKQDTETTQLSYQMSEQPSSEILELVEEDETRGEGTAVGMAMPLPEVPLQPILTLMRRLCSALSCLHSEGIVHRDLKPDNILVLAGGYPVLVDFGIASAQSTTGREQMTLGDRSQQGTISYMSMEQIQGDPLDARADLFSMGVLFFELLTGQRPYAGENPQAILWSLFSKTPPKPSQLVANIPPALDELVMRLISLERNNRPGYAADVAQALLALGAEKDNDEALLAKTYLYRPSFAGRTQELEQLRQRAIQIRNEQGGLYLVDGESGVGKTRLLLEAGRDLSQRGLTVLLGECKDAGVALNAFRKVLQDLSDRCVERGYAEAEKIFGRRGKLLSLYEPALRDAPGQDAHPEPTGEPQQEELFQALTETLSAASPRQPLVLLLDDLQWADELSLEFLDFFVARRDLQRWILVIGAYRTEETSRQLKGLLEAPAVERLSLQRLPEEAVAQMVGDMLALTPPPQQLSRYLAEHSFGNPFFVAEYLRAAVDERLLRRDAAGRWQVVRFEDEAGENISGRWQLSGAAEANYDRLALPRTLKALIERRVAGLSKMAKTALESFAVIGRVAELELLEWVIPLTEEMLEEALDELSRRQIIEEAAPSKLRIIHEKIRELSYERLSPKARSGLHRATAEAIEGMYEDREEHLADLGHHWEQAGATEKARRYYLRGARRAVQVYHHKEAERLYAAFFRLNHAPTKHSIIARNELAEKVYQIKGRFAEAEEEHLRALEEARGLALQEEIIDSLRNMGQIKRWRGEPEDAGRYLAEAHHLALELQDQRRLGAILNTIANLHLFRGQLSSAQHLYEQALEAHRAVQNTRMEGITLTNLATLFMQQGAPERSQPLFEQAVQIAIQLKDPRIEANAQLNIAALYVQQGELERAHQIFEQALSIFRALGDRRFEAIALVELADVERWRAQDLSPAMRLAAQAEALLRGVGDKQALGKLLRLQGHLAIANGESAQALIEEIEGLAVELRAEPESDLRQRLQTLLRAERTRREHEPNALLRGQRLDDLPAPLKQRLLSSGLS